MDAQSAYLLELLRATVMRFAGTGGNDAFRG